MILAGYILKDGQVFSNFTAPLSLKDKSLLRRLSTFKPDPKLYDLEPDKSCFSLAGEETTKSRSYFTLRRVKKPLRLSLKMSKEGLLDELCVLSQNFTLYNNHFMVVFLIQKMSVRFASIESAEDLRGEGKGGEDLEEPGEIRADVCVRTGGNGRSSVESFNSSPEDVGFGNGKPCEGVISVFEENPLDKGKSLNEEGLKIRIVAEPDLVESKVLMGAENEKMLGSVVEEIKSEIIRSFFYRLEKGDVGLFFSQILHRNIVQSLEIGIYFDSARL